MPPIILWPRRARGIHKHFDHAGNQKPMPIIFLDFDGVLHPADEGEKALMAENGSSPQIFTWAESLASLINDFPAVRVIIHSAWRNVFPLEDLKALLPAALASRVCATTQPGLPRWDSIELYLNDQEAKHRCKCQFIIIDDEPCEFPASHPSLIVCNPALGMSEKSTMAAIHDWLRSLP